MRSTRWLVLSFIAACADLPRLEPGVCGNGAIDQPSEDCDLSEGEGLGEGVRCGDPADTLRACRYVCSRDTGGPRCPIGWGCSDDGICRFASGTFEEMEDSPVELGSYSRLEFADVDGDRRRDLVTSSGSGVGVFYGRRTDPFAAQFHYPQSLSGEIAIEDFDRDGRSDVVAVSPVGPILLHGRRDRTLLPALVSRLDRSVLAPDLDWLRLFPLVPNTDLPCNQSIDPMGPTQLLAVGYGTRVLLVYPPDPPLEVIDFEVPLLPSRLLAANLDADTFGGSGGSELVVALPGTAVAHVYAQSCRDRGPLGLERDLADLPIPLPGPVASSVHPVVFDRIQDTALAADVDGDGDRDLFFPVTGDFSPEPDPVHVAYAENLGGGFAPAAIAPEFQAFIDAAANGGEEPSDFGRPQRWPLAAGDLDGDGDADFVASTGIFERTRAQDPEGAPRLEVRLPAPLIEAVVADVDGDGLNDVVAVSARSASLVVYSSVGGGGRAFLSPAYEYPSNGTPSALSLGDFDGDGVTDVAYIEHGNQFGTSLAVLYGARDALFSVFPLGSPGLVRDIQPASAGVDDGRTDLFMVSESRSVDGRWAIGLLFGAAERTMTSPLPIGATGTDQNRVAVGELVRGSTPDPDLAVLTPRGLDVGAGDGTGRYGESVAPRFTPWDRLLGVADVELAPECTKLAVAELNGDAATEELIAVIDGECKSRFDPMTGPGGSSTSGLSTLAIATDTAAGFRAAAIDLAEPIRTIEEVHVFDLDGSGATEVLLVYGRALFAGPFLPDEGEVPGRAVAIFWNVGFDLAASPAISFEGGAPSFITLDDPNRAPFALASLNADEDRALELAILGTDAEGGSAFLWVESIDGRTDRALGPPSLELQVAPNGVLELLAEDLDRDGLSDLVFGDGGRVHLFRSVPEGEVVR